ncbi:MAG: 4Fe-4S dicluster domain-containing protein, partial [Candidatus Krumholzibacteria bacterium]|nr:4Fe-4S dicluster domain-containing protein [Candidatus Krumholzibacteria bacterium]
VDFSVASNLEYTSEEKKLLSDQRVKLGMGFCRQCRVCMSTCPRGVEIPSLMRTHMYAVQYSNFIRQEPPLMRSRRDMDSKPADRVRYARLDAPTLSISPGR